MKINNLTDKEIQDIERQTLATMNHEFLQPSEAAIEINRQFLEGKITSNEAIDKIKKKYCVMVGRLGKC